MEKETSTDKELCDVCYSPQFGKQQPMLRQVTQIKNKYTQNVRTIGKVAKTMDG
jgi:hypothetical protein